MLAKQLLLAVVCVVAAVGCSQSAHTTSDLDDARTAQAAADSSQKAAQQALDAAQADRETNALLAFDAARPFPKWTYQKNTDPMTDKTVYIAELSSEEKLDLPFPYEGEQSGTLMIRVNANGETDVVFHVRKGQILCHGYGSDACPYTQRIDQDSPVVLNGSPPSDNSSDTVFLPVAGILAKRLATSQKLRLQLTFFNAGDHVFTFDVAGFELSKLYPPEAATKALTPR